MPVPPNAKVLKVPTDMLDPEQIRIGLYWTAPYLHDGGVIAGADAKKQLGFPGTLDKGIQPDPANSLRALVDKKLREQVIAANRLANLQEVHVQGIGHDYWVDETTGFTQQEQEALIKYLLLLK